MENVQGTEVKFTKKDGNYYVHKDGGPLGDPFPELFDDLATALACSYMLDELQDNTGSHFLIASYAITKLNDRPYCVFPIPGAVGKLVAQFNGECFIMGQGKLEKVLSIMKKCGWRSSVNRALVDAKREIACAALESLRDAYGIKNSG